MVLNLEHTQSNILLFQETLALCNYQPDTLLCQGSFFQAVSECKWMSSCAAGACLAEVEGAHYSRFHRCQPAHQLSRHLSDGDRETGPCRQPQPAYICLWKSNVIVYLGRQNLAWQMNYVNSDTSVPITASFRYFFICSTAGTRCRPIYKTKNHTITAELGSKLKVML